MHVFGSRWLVNELSRLGFSISYEHFPCTFTQWIADIDHNVSSLDGTGSLHGMRIIAVSTPKDNVPLIAKSRVTATYQGKRASERKRSTYLTIMSAHTGKVWPLVCTNRIANSTHFAARTILQSTVAFWMDV